MSKKRITLRVEDNEIAVVGPAERWEHLIQVYKILAIMYPEDEASWIDAAEWIRTAISKAHNNDDWRLVNGH